MANLFEKPIAANPISEFAGLPLQFLAGLDAQKRQESRQSMMDDRNESRYQEQREYTRGRDAVSDARFFAQEDRRNKGDELASLRMTGQAQENLLKMKGLTKDTTRLNEVMGEYESRIEKASSLSPENAALETQKLMNEIRSNKEIRAINSNYLAGTSSLEEANKRYLAGKTSLAGYRKAQAVAANFKTKADEFNNYNKFSGYTPSNVADVVAELTKIAKSSEKQYDENGMMFKGKDDLFQTLNSSMIIKPELEQALGEAFDMTYKEDPKVNRQEAYIKYRNATLGQIVKDQSMQEIDKAATGEGEYSGDVVMTNFQHNTDGSTSNYEGGTLTGIRSLLKEAGWDTTKKFKDYLKTNIGKHEIRSMEEASGKKFPTSHSEQVDFIEQYSKGSSVSNIITEKIDKGLANTIIDKLGFIKVKGQIKNQAGEIMSDKFINDNIQGKTKTGPAAKVIRRIKKGAGMEGDYILQGADNQLYIMEAMDFESISNPVLIHKKLTSVKDVNAFPTGRKTTKIATPFKISGGIIPSGVYESRRIPEGKTKSGTKTPPYILLLQNDKPMFMTTGQVSGDLPVYTKPSQEFINSFN